MNYVGSYDNQNNIYIKRVYKDIILLQKKYEISFHNIFKINNKFILYFYLNNRQYIFGINIHYPFKVPVLKINKKLYYFYYFDKYKNIKEKCPIINIKCPCCENILCNWCPTLRLNDLLYDCIKYEKIYKDLISFYIFYNNNIFDDLINQYVSFYLFN